MPNKTYRRVLALGILSLIGVLSFQAYLLKDFNERTVKEREDNIIASLYSVIDVLYEINPDAGKIISPVKKVSEGYFRVQVNDTLHPYLLEELVKEAFKEHNISEPFEYAIYDCFTDSTVYAARVDYKESSANKTKHLDKLRWQSDGHYFAVFFPGIPNARVNIPDVLKLSFIMLLALIAVFGYTLVTLYREKRLQRIKQDFINNVTHQLRTPVSGLMLGIAAIKQQPDNTRALGLMEKEIKRLKGTIEKVLLASKAEEAKRKPEQLINLEECIRGWAADKEAVKLGALTCESVKIFEEHFHLVLDILHENSVKHNPSMEVALKIWVEQKDKSCVVHVLDNGQGIQSKEIDRVFSKFYSSKNADINQPKGGFGLGLYIAAQVCNQMNVSIAAVEDNTGAHFTLKLNTYG